MRSEVGVGPGDDSCRRGVIVGCYKHLAEPAAGRPDQPERRSLMTLTTTQTMKQTTQTTAGLERALTDVARAILRLEVPRHVLAEGEFVDRAGYWLLVRVSERATIRLSELADCVELDLSTVSRQMRDLVSAGLVDKQPDPDDGRASLLSISARGAIVLEAVSEARRMALANAVAEWSDDERMGLATGLSRLADGLHLAHVANGTKDGTP